MGGGIEVVRFSVEQSRGKYIQESNPCISIVLVRSSLASRWRFSCDGDGIGEQKFVSVTRGYSAPRCSTT